VYQLIRLVVLIRGWFVQRRMRKALKQPESAQRLLLKQILATNAQTRFGKEHNFEELGSHRDYAQKVSVNTYETLRPYVDEIASGRGDILTNAPPFMFATTSGTTDKPKLIPVTSRCRDAIAALGRFWLFRTLVDHPDVLRHCTFALTSPAIEGHTEAGIPHGAISGLINQKVPAVIRARYSVPYEVALVENYDLRYYLAMRLAVARRTSMICTANPSTVLRLVEIGEEKGEHIIQAVHDGALGIKEEDLPHDKPEQMANLQLIKEHIRANPKRARFLSECFKSTGGLYPKDIWPELKVLGCWLGGSVGIHAKKVRGYLGPDVAMRDLGFRATEGTLAIPISDEISAGVPSLNAYFFEFIPEEEIESPDRNYLLAHELELGKRYYILITSEGGLYRYDINDVIEVKGFYEKTPLIAFVRKGRDMVNITGEKLHVNQVLDALRSAEESTGIGWVQAQIIPDVPEVRYELLIESEKDYLDEDLRGFTDNFDAALGAANVEYNQKRASGRLGAPTLHIMKPGWADRHQKNEVLQKGKRDAQYKWRYIQYEWSTGLREEVLRSLQ